MTTEKLTRGNEPTSYCMGKRRLPTFLIAQQAAQRGSRRTESRRQAYKCHHCGDWHVGTGLAPKGMRVGRKQRAEVEA